MNLAPEVPVRAPASPQSGTGVPCQVAQCDGVPCADVKVNCEHCDRAVTAPVPPFTRGPETHHA